MYVYIVPSALNPQQTKKKKKQLDHTTPTLKPKPHTRKPQTLKPSFAIKYLKYLRTSRKEFGMPT